MYSQALHDKNAEADAANEDPSAATAYEDATASTANEDTTAAASETDEVNSAADEAPGRAQTSCSSKGKVADC